MRQQFYANIMTESQPGDVVEIGMPLELDGSGEIVDGECERLLEVANVVARMFLPICRMEIILVDGLSNEIGPRRLINSKSRVGTDRGQSAMAAFQ